MNNLKYKLMITVSLILVISYQPLVVMAQTLDELENEIAQIVEDTEKQKEKQAQIKADKADTEAEIEDVKAEIDQIKTNIASEQTKISNKNSEIETQKGKIEEIQAQIPEAKDEADGMLQVMQKVENSNILLQMVATPSGRPDDNILRRMESVGSISEYAGGVVLELVEIEKELQYEKAMLDKQLAQLEQSHTALETEQTNLEAKEAEFKQVLANQSESINDIDVAAKQAAEDQAMMEDTLAYYQSYGCSGSDVVGSNCGGLGDDDRDGVQNSNDSCPSVAGDMSDGCPSPVSDNSGSSNSGSSSSNNSVASESSASFISPMSSGVVTCEYACYNGHVGIDLDLVDYAPILATSSGVVTTARGGCAPFAAGVNTCNGGYGNYVMVTHYTSSGVFFSLYAHLSSISVSQGQTVSQGQQVGLLGDSGNSAGSHLHFELYKDANGNGIPDDYKTNPRNYVSLPATGVYW